MSLLQQGKHLCQREPTGASHSFAEPPSCQRGPSSDFYGKTPLPCFQTHATPCSIRDKIQSDALVFGDQCRSDVSPRGVGPRGAVTAHRRVCAPERSCGGWPLWDDTFRASEICVERDQTLHDAKVCQSRASKVSLSFYWCWSLGRWDFTSSTNTLTLAAQHLSGNPGAKKSQIVLANPNGHTVALADDTDSLCSVGDKDCLGRIWDVDLLLWSDISAVVMRSAERCSDVCGEFSVVTFV